MAEETKKAAEEAATSTPVEETKATEPVAETPETKETEAASKEAEAPKAEEKAPVAEAPAAAEKAPAKEVKAEKPAKTTAPKLSEINPLEDFDWSLLGKQTEEYSDEERKRLEDIYDKTLTSIAEHEVVEGIVVKKTKKEVVVNIGYKSDGIVPVSEFRYNPDLDQGHQVEVYVEAQEDKNGQLVLSHKKARTLKAWENVNNALKNEEVIKGFVKCRTKGGLIVDVFGIEAFLPGSQIDVKPIRDYDMYVGKAMEFKVVKINQEFRNVVVSHKALIEAELEQQKAEIISKLEKGQVLEGTVKNITSYGVFIDLGGVDGLIHITDLSWGRINHPEEIVELDQKLNVVILDFDDEKKRIALGLKQLSKHPWEALDENLKVGDTVKGKVVVLADYGAFVEIAPGVEGLIHVSEMSWSQHLRTAQDFFKVGDAVEAVIMTLDREERKMSLSTRRLTPDPWEEIESKYPVDSRHNAKVTNLSNFGVFVELEEGIDGLVHISDLSWSKKINHPGEVTKVGEPMDVVVLEIDKDNRRLSLGHKQLEENPWTVFESVFTLGSIHQGTILNKTDKGGIVALPYGVEGFAPNRHLMKVDAKRAEADETLDFEVLEFNKDAKKIIVSHTRLHEAASKAERDAENKRQKSQDSATRKKVANMNEKVERTTLGDLSVLASLKSEMEDAEKAAVVPAKKAPAKAKKAAAPAVEEAPKAEETPAEEKAPATKEAPVAEETAKAEAPAEETAKTEAPAEETAKEEAPAEETAKEEAPAEEAAKAEAPAEEAAPKAEEAASDEDEKKAE